MSLPGSLPFQWDHGQGGRSWSWTHGPCWEHIQPLPPSSLSRGSQPRIERRPGPLAAPATSSPRHVSLRCLQTPNHLAHGATVRSHGRAGPHGTRIAWVQTRMGLDLGDSGWPLGALPDSPLEVGYQRQGTNGAQLSLRGLGSGASQLGMVGRGQNWAWGRGGCRGQPRARQGPRF